MNFFKKSYISQLSKYISTELGIVSDQKIKECIERFVEDNFDLLKIYDTTLDFQYIDLTELINEITINETYFFRDVKQIEYVKKDLINRIKNNEEVVIWSLGCSSGEEPYTLAILCSEIGILDKVKIFAFDINTKVLEKAKEGIYTKWSFRGVEKYYIDKYFSKKNENSFQISKDISDKVFFKEFNIKKDIFDEDVMQNYFNPDIVFCRNILMYFDEKTFIDISNQIENLLNKNAYVITSAQENYILKKSKLKQEFKDGIFVFYKEVLDDTENETNIIKDTNEELDKNLFYDNDNRETLNKIINLIYEKKYEETLIYIEILINKDPHDFFNYLLKAKVLYNLDNIKTAEFNIKKAVFLNSTCPVVHYEYGKILIKHNLKDRAKKHFAKANKLIYSIENNNAFEDLKIKNTNTLELLKINKSSFITNIRKRIESLELSNAKN